MLRVKRISAAAAIFAMFLLPAAASAGCTQSGIQRDSKTSVVCTIFPQYDWVRQILGDKADSMDLTLLLSNKADLHSYQPSVDDIVKISTCDLLIYVGGISDGWVEATLSDTINEKMIVINLLEALGDAVKTEEIVEGMEDDDDNESGDDKDEYDEHVWLSLKNAIVLCNTIAAALVSLDAGNAEAYQNNLELYIGKLTALDSEYRAAVDAAPVRMLLFGDRFPFRYILDDYGIDYFAAFAGCSAETEASFKTIIFLTEKTDEFNLRNIMVTESSDKKIAETIIRESRDKNQRILVMDAIQSVASVDVENGATYLSIMESNLRVLKEALS